ncbi:MAG: hypothetical protein WCZ90_09095 [Melioribacteraceae bacterium]
MNYKIHYISVHFILLLILIGCSHTNEPENPTIINVLNESQKQAGKYVVAWYQIDNNSQKVTAGNYNVQIETKNMKRNVWNAYFTISSTAKHIPAISNIVDKTEKPKSYFLDVNSSTYALGDTVLIYFDLPKDEEYIKIDLVK